MTNDIYDFRAQIARALANPIRLKIINQHSIRIKKSASAELVESLECDQPSVSKHLAVLKSARLIAFRQEGTRMLSRPVQDTLHKEFSGLHRPCDQAGHPDESRRVGQSGSGILFGNGTTRQAINFKRSEAWAKILR